MGTDGLPVGEQFGISWEGSNSRLRPRVAANQQNGEFLVVWEYAFTDTDHDIYARRVSGAGVLIGNGVPNLLRSRLMKPALNYNPDKNEYLMVWIRQDLTETATADVWGRRMAAD